MEMALLGSGAVGAAKLNIESSRARMSVLALALDICVGLTFGLQFSRWRSHVINLRRSHVSRACTRYWLAASPRAACLCTTRGDYAVHHLAISAPPPVQLSNQPPRKISDRALCSTGNLLVSRLLLACLYFVPSSPVGRLQSRGHCQPHFPLHHILFGVFLFLLVMN